MLHPDQDYFGFLAQGRFMVQRSLDTGRCFFYPRVAEPGTGSTRLEWFEPSGKGVIVTRPTAGASAASPGRGVNLSGSK